MSFKIKERRLGDELRNKTEGVGVCLPVSRVGRAGRSVTLCVNLCGSQCKFLDKFLKMSFPRKIVPLHFLNNRGHGIDKTEKSIKTYPERDGRHLPEKRQ